jgi:hypothetical protein
MLHVYPVKDGIPTSERNRMMGVGQEEVNEGRFKARFVPIQDIAKHRDAVTAILNDVNFDE